MKTKTASNKLNRFTTLPVLLDMLINRRLVFSDPKFWEDKNDSEVLRIYMRRKFKDEKNMKLFALCFLEDDETIHHWKAFADGISGCCIEFDKEKLLKLLSAHEARGIRFGSVEYKKISEVAAEVIDCVDKIPFIKRIPYWCEKEFRVIWESDAEDHEITIEDFGVIKQITLSPELPDHLLGGIQTLLEGYFHCDQKPKINLSTIKRSVKWIGNFEILDVVNERDEVIGRKPRSEVHRLALKHRAIHVLVFNSLGETFLQKRSMTKDREPGKWDSSSSGHVDSGEDYDACAVRELREEIGLAIAKAPERLFKIAACPETDAEFVWVYRCQAEGPFQLHPDEIERGGWFAPEQITRWIEEKPGDFAGAFRFIWLKFNAEAPRKA